MSHVYAPSAGLLLSLPAPAKDLAALADLPAAFAARRRTQATRKASSWDIAQAMTWNPLDLLGRRVVIRRPRRSGGSAA
jgi:hypothetical protein